jgi:hypothetical protein
MSRFGVVALASILLLAAAVPASSDPVQFRGRAVVGPDGHGLLSAVASTYRSNALISELPLDETGPRPINQETFDDIAPEAPP